MRQLRCSLRNSPALGWRLRDGSKRRGHGIGAVQLLRVLLPRLLQCQQVVPAPRRPLTASRGPMEAMCWLKRFVLRRSQLSCRNGMYIPNLLGKTVVRAGLAMGQDPNPLTTQGIFFPPWALALLAARGEFYQSLKAIQCSSSDQSFTLPC